jgi:hypothetical protein
MPFHPTDDELVIDCTFSTAEDGEEQHCTCRLPGGESVTARVGDDGAAGNPRVFTDPGSIYMDGKNVLGLARIDVEGAGHGRSGSLMQRLQAVLSDDADHVRRYAEGLQAGHYVVGVAVGEDEAAKQRAADALRGAGAEPVHYYAEKYVEDLDA